LAIWEKLFKGGKFPRFRDIPRVWHIQADLLEDLNARKDFWDMTAIFSSEKNSGVALFVCKGAPSETKV
jgi:hypothetical protein